MMKQVGNVLLASLLDVQSEKRRDLFTQANKTIPDMLITKWVLVSSQTS